MTTILIVDDHPLYRQGLAGALQQQVPPLNVLGVDTAEAGATALHNDRSIELAIVDLHLPDMDGCAAIASYARTFPAVGRALISGDENPALCGLARSNGASAFFPKSLPVGEMIAAIQVLLQGGTWFPEPQAFRARTLSEAGLSLRQLEVITLAATGAPNKEIAAQLGIAERTVKTHLEAIFEHLGVKNRTQAVLQAVARGLVAQPIEK
jgi:DNA-binding NarL/FixJ family response regulator